jgi:hypothetical protein
MAGLTARTPSRLARTLTFPRSPPSPALRDEDQGALVISRLCRPPIRHRRPCLALAVASPLWLCGCANTVFPPQHVTDPIQVGVLDHGHHTSLILQIASDGMRRYSYGDWRWYALRQTGLAEGSAAVFSRTQAALGRKELPGPFSPAAVVREVRVPIEHALYLTVDAGDIRTLVARLDRIYDANLAERVDNQAYDLVFVPHPEPYSIFHNSNRVVAEWLEQLQCRVEGPALFAIWQPGADQSGSGLAAAPDRGAARRHFS